jgi:uncharacterized repeat protein (TIGR01451 family)
MVARIVLVGKSHCAWLVGLTIFLSGSLVMAGDPQPRAAARTAQFIQPGQIPQTPEPPLADQRPQNIIPRAQPVPGVQQFPGFQPGIFTAPIPVPRSAPEGYHEDPPTPVVSLRIRVPATASAGQDLEYRICIENLSAAPAHHVIVRNPVPANARFVRANPEPSAKEPELIWNLGTLAACACKEIALVLSPTGTGDIQDCARVQFEHGQCVTTRIAKPAISVRKTGPKQAVLNAVLSYQLTVTNTGSTELTSIVLSDKLPAGLVHSSGQRDLSWNLGNLAPGQSQVVDYQVTAAAAGTHRNKASATAAGGVHDEVEHEIVVSEVKMGLTMTGPAKAIVGTPVTYQITVSNTGSLPLSNVVIDDPIPAQMTLDSARNGGQLMKPTVPSSGPDLVRWAIGSLEPGAVKTVEVVLRSTAAGRICNRARATADGGQTAQAEACTDFEGQAGLLLMVVDTMDPVVVGGQTSYPITIRNTGFARVTNVVIKADVPPELTVTDVKTPININYSQKGQVVTFQAIDIDPGREVRYEVIVKANKAGDVRFKVDMTADQLTSGAVHREESTNIFNELKNGQENSQKKANDKP